MSTHAARSPAFAPDWRMVDGLRYGLLGLPLAFCALPLYVLMPNLRFPDPDPNFAAQTGNG